MLIVDVEMAGHVKFVISLRHPPSLVVVLVVISVADGLMLVLVFVGCLVIVEVTGGDDRQKLSLKYQHGGGNRSESRERGLDNFCVLDPLVGYCLVVMFVCVDMRMLQ